MILERLTLSNYCLYRGEQTFNLAPARRGGKAAPIVLLGGINGGGKTTVLDAIQLALYGSRALCSKRGSLGYEQFLRECIHHGVEPGESASVALSFHYAAEGEEHLYEVHRAWKLRGQKVHEELAVSRDGLPDRSLADDWNNFVEELVPLGISQLFFFDAEKIRFLAEDETCSAVLGAAIKSLLGLDLAERLIADAGVLESRLARQVLTDDAREEIERLDAEIETHDLQITAIREQKASAKTELEGAAGAVRQAERRFAARGGEYWQQRESRQHRLGEVDNQQSTLEVQLLALAGGALPIALVPHLLQRVAEQDEREHRFKESRSLLELLQRRDGQLLAAIESAAVAAKAVAAVRRWQDGDRAKREEETCHVERRLAISDHARDVLRGLGGHLTEDVAALRSLSERLHNVKQERESLNRAIAAAPDDESIKGVAEQLRGALADEASAAAKDRRAADEETSLLAARKALNAQRAKLLGKRTDADWYRKRRSGADGEARGRELRGNDEGRISAPSRRPLCGKIHRLSMFITESFRYLLRKKTLVQQIHIDPESFAVQIFDDSGHAIPKRRLSEGEKQIFAIAVLWGLARASARSLPAIIDTPMARLDVTHRNHLVERYFPHASYQVIILSTDTEVDRRYYDELAPFISRAYHYLSYDEAEKRTVAEEGYFWEREAAAVAAEEAS